MKSKLTIILFFLLTVFLTGCNNEVFVNRLPEIEDDIYLDGNGGKYTFKVQKKGLEGLGFENEFDYRCRVYYYDRNGDLLYNITHIDEVAKILYSSERFVLEFLINGDKITVTALDNSYPVDMTVWAYLSYEYVSKTVTFHISPGLPAEISDLNLDTSLPVTGQKVEKGHSMRFSNDSPVEQHIYIYPYQEYKSRAMVTPDEAWQDGISVKVALPYFDGDRWIVDESDETEVTLGATVNYYSFNAPVDEVFVVDVPPYSTATYTPTITYATLDVRYFGLITLPNSGFSFHVTGVCHLRQPVGFNFEVIGD